jgi:hypothetical protein
MSKANAIDSKANPVDATRYDITKKAWDAGHYAHRHAEDTDVAIDAITDAALTLLNGVWGTGWGSAADLGWLTSENIKLLFIQSVESGLANQCPYLMENWGAVLDYAVKKNWTRREYQVNTRAKTAAATAGTTRNK